MNALDKNLRFCSEEKEEQKSWKIFFEILRKGGVELKTLPRENFTRPKFLLSVKKATSRRHTLLK